MRITLDRVPVPPEAWRAIQDPPGHYDLALPLYVSERPAQVRRLELASPTFVPRDCEAGNADPRQLGVLVEALRLDDADAPLKFVNLPVYPSLPLFEGPAGAQFEFPIQHKCGPQTGGFKP
jgi:hypothetical protein